MRRRRDWPSRFIVIAQAMVGSVALLALVAFLTLNPYWLLAFAFSQIFLVIGALLFVSGVLMRKAEPIAQTKEAPATVAAASAIVADKAPSRARPVPQPLQADPGRFARR